jgi:hypothetical protein
MPSLEESRLSLHVVAELLLAGPQFEQSRSIKLRAAPGGFATESAPEAGVVGTDLVVGGRSVPLDGRTVAEVAADAGIVARPLDDVYAGGCGLTVEHRLAVDPGHAAQIADSVRLGDEALAMLAPEAERVLWPEHFDIGITVDEVNFGVSPGDTYFGAPYAYVGPWAPADHSGPFWNAPFGAARPMEGFRDAHELLQFLREGQDLAAGRSR